MRSLRILIVLVLLTLDPPTVFAIGPTISAVSDDAVTTLSVAMNLALGDALQEGGSRANHIIALNSHFQDHLDHPLIGRLRDLLYAGKIGYAIHTGLMLDPPSFEQGGQSLVRHLSSHLETIGPDLAAFYRDVDMASFLADNRSLFDGAAALLAQNVSVTDEIQFLEAFWGFGFSEYRFVVVPTVRRGDDFGATVREGDRLVACFLVGPETSIRTPRHAVGPIGLGYHHGQWIGSTAVHEFGHSFYGVALSETSDAIAAAADWMIPESVPVDGYGTPEQNWHGYVEEYVVRAIDALYTAETRGEAAASAMLDEDQTRGFHAIRMFYAHVVRYHENRDRYSTFAEYAPTIISDLRAMRRTGHFRPVLVSNASDLTLHAVQSSLTAT